MSDRWLEQAASMPIAFAQVREDPRVDLAALDTIDRDGLDGIMIASGGCTAAVLAASGRFASLELVDVNPAQLALTRLKLHLLRERTPQQRLELLGHATLTDRKQQLGESLITLGLPRDILGPLDRVAELGPDHAGRYELLFAELRAAMPSIDWPGVLLSTAQFDRDGMDAAFDRVMCLETLVALFGREATQNSVQSFARHFAHQTQSALSMDNRRHNPFLWQLLVGHFPPGVAYDWLTLVAPPTLPRLTWTHASMTQALSSHRQRFDYVHLSNILDWLSPDAASQVLSLAFEALRPGGVVLLRQLNSSLDLPALGERFDWLGSEADRLHAMDRSFFYRRLCLGQRR